MNRVLINPKHLGYNHLRYELTGPWLLEAIADAKRIMGDSIWLSELELEGILVRVRRDSDTNRVNQAWVRALKCPLPRTVGPYPRMWLEVPTNFWFQVLDVLGRPYYLGTT